MHAPAAKPELYGVAAEFKTADALTKAASAVKNAGFTKFDAYTPYPVHGLETAMGEPFTKLPFVVFLAGLTGGTLGLSLQYWVSVLEYPLNIGGRPLFSWPMFIPITFECTILAAAFGSVLGLLAFIGLPRPHHPIFNTANFDRATVDRFFLCIEAEDPKFDRAATRSFLEGLGPDAVTEVKN